MTPGTGKGPRPGPETEGYGRKSGEVNTAKVGMRGVILRPVEGIDRTGIRAGQRRMVGGRRIQEGMRKKEDAR